MAVSPNVVPAIVLLPLEMVGGAPQSTTGRIRIAINTELALIAVGTEGGEPESLAQWVSIIVIERMHPSNLPEQVGRGSQFRLAIQLAVAVVTPAETSYPLSQV